MRIAAKHKLAKAKQFFNQLKAEANPVKAFEMFASVLFAVVTGQAQATDGARITKLMCDAGKSFTLEEVNGAVQRLRDHGFLPAV